MTRQQIFRGSENLFIFDNVVGILKFLKGKKDAYFRRKREQDRLEKYGPFLLLIISWIIGYLTPGDTFENFGKYLLVFGLLFMQYLYRRITKSRKELANKNQEILLQKELIENHRRDILDSINYALRIQNAILPRANFEKIGLPDSFLLYKPKDIVAGDFYWIEKTNDAIYIAAADCTGHGVPGAMVSVICSTALSRAVKEFGIRNTGEILDKATDIVMETFEKSETEMKDGMDISLISINLNKSEFQWSGANNPLWYFIDGEIKEIKADKQPVGYYTSRKKFTTHQVNEIDDAMIYLFTDGFPDQFGGPNGKKFKYLQLKETFSRISQLSGISQKQELDKIFEKWRGSLEQVDDVCVIGVRMTKK